jgi:hypothetical protein
VRALLFLLAFPTTLGSTPALGEQAPEAPDAGAAKGRKAAEATAPPARSTQVDTEDVPAPTPPTGARTSSFGAGFDWFFDSGEQTVQQVNSGGGDLVEGRSDISNDSVILGGGIALNFWFMTEIASRLSFGGNLRFLGTHGYTLDSDEDNPIDLGQMLELGPRLQYLLPITDRLGLAIGGEVALALLFPGRDLGRRIDTLAAQGFDVTGLPRIGFLFGPQVGARYGLSEWLAVRADLGYLWEWLFLLNTSAESGGLRGEEEWDVDWTRVRIHLGAELMF